MHGKRMKSNSQISAAGLFMLLVVLAAPSWSQSTQAKVELSSAKSTESAIFDRVAFVGASVSDGFGNNLPPSTVFEKILRVEHQPVAKFTNSMFFIDPEGEGKRQLDRAIAAKSSLVIGVDFLFWYCYGVVSMEDRKGADGREENEAAMERRLKLFEKGLKELEKLQMPVVVGNIPDMFGADPQMMTPQMVPSPLVLAKVNERLMQWAKDRKNILVLPLADWVREMRSAKAVLEVGPNNKVAYDSTKLLQKDRLHPSQLGVVMLCSRLTEKLQGWVDASLKKQLMFDAKASLEEIGEELPKAGSQKG